MHFVAPGQSKAPQSVPALPPAPSASSARPLQPKNGGNCLYFNHAVQLFTFVSSTQFVLTILSFSKCAALTFCMHNYFENKCIM